ncbi:hypothetical protein [Nevskia sp.]|uniref:hypothetical protein n=1 Tax=Nevskia sp. TaxID=1929292 RepID=UPI0025F08024|nr:hypothetical protein [Nevskia sp.]
MAGSATPERDAVKRATPAQNAELRLRKRRVWQVGLTIVVMLVIGGWEARVIFGKNGLAAVFAIGNILFFGWTLVGHSIYMRCPAGLHSFPQYRPYRVCSSCNVHFDD